jgi:aminoglycoside phosphotransferase (APT) family kinase protein
VDEVEIPLSGGSVAAGVVRVGATVRRPWERWTPAVHALLRHLEQRGFEAAPKVVGRDHRGREVLTYVDGETCRRPWLPALRTAAGLAALADLVRRLHVAASTFQPPSGAEWVDGTTPLRRGEIVCHGDIGPWNTVWRDAQPVGIIDWDFARPMNPLDDLAYVAFYAVPLRDDDHCRGCGFEEPPDRAARLDVVCSAYGGVDARDVWHRAERHHERDAVEIEMLGRRDLHPWSGFLERGLDHEARQLLGWLRDNRHIVNA